MSWRKRKTPTTIPDESKKERHRLYLEAVRAVEAGRAGRIQYPMRRHGFMHSDYWVVDIGRVEAAFSGTSYVELRAVSSWDFPTIKVLDPNELVEALAAKGLVYDPPPSRDPALEFWS